jgi:hypothetical protein
LKDEKKEFTTLSTKVRTLEKQGKDFKQELLDPGSVAGFGED